MVAKSNLKQHYNFTLFAEVDDDGSIKSCTCSKLVKGTESERERVCVSEKEREGESLNGEVAKVLQALCFASSIRQFVTGPTQSYFSYSLTYATTVKKPKAMPNKATEK